MSITINIGEKVRREGIEYFTREAVRGIMMDGSKIFVLSNNMDDYKIPGGGIEQGESKEGALKREIKEETGYSIKQIMDEVLITLERRPDVYEENSGFEMISYYFLCTRDNHYIGQKLDDYEAKLDFKPVWIEMSKVLEHNEKLLRSDKVNNPWVEREVQVMKYLVEHYLES